MDDAPAIQALLDRRMELRQAISELSHELNQARRDLAQTLRLLPQTVARAKRQVATFVRSRDFRPGAVMRHSSTLEGTPSRSKRLSGAQCETRDRTSRTRTCGTISRGGSPGRCISVMDAARYGRRERERMRGGRSHSGVH